MTTTLDRVTAAAEALLADVSDLGVLGRPTVTAALVAIEIGQVRAEEEARDAGH